MRGKLDSRGTQVQPKVGQAGTTKGGRSMLWARSSRWVLPLLCLLPTGVAAQVPAELRELMRARDLAVAKADAATWDRLTTDDFTVVTPDGTMLTKAERLAQLKQQKPDTLRSVLQELITRYGDVVVRRLRRPSGTGEVWIMDVWVKDARGWRVAAVQVTGVAKK